MTDDPVLVELARANPEPHPRSDPADEQLLAAILDRPAIPRRRGRSPARVLVPALSAAVVIAVAFVFVRAAGHTGPRDPPHRPGLSALVSALVGRVPDGLDVVSVRVEEEGAVVARGVLGARTRSPVVTSAGGQAFTVKALDLLVARRGEGEVDRRRQRPTRDEADVLGARRAEGWRPVDGALDPIHPEHQRRSVEGDGALEVTNWKGHVIDADGSHRRKSTSAPVAVDEPGNGAHPTPSASTRAGPWRGVLVDERSDAIAVARSGAAQWRARSLIHAERFPPPTVCPPMSQGSEAGPGRCVSASVDEVHDVGS